MEQFVLLADRRSGTTLVIDCLNNLERVSCEKRAFGIDKIIKNPSDNRHSGMFFLYRTANWQRKLQYYVQRQKLTEQFLRDSIFTLSSPKDIRGFRLIYHKADQHPEALNCLRGTGTKVIHLIRENVLKTHISFLTAPMHKMHHPRHGDNIKTVKLNLDPTPLLVELRKRVAKIEAKRQLVSDFAVLEISYESFVSNREAEAARIQPFLGMDEITPFQTDLVKINPDTLDGVLDNPDEIRNLLAGTEFESMLY